MCCILSKFYIKPQQHSEAWSRFYVVSYRNSTSNHNFCSYALCCWPVVSYRNSTSNHNSRAAGTISAGVVSYRNSTSNHNISHWRETSQGLYLIEILHQTTTLGAAGNGYPGCILSKFYIKPQQKQITRFSASCCILSKFYIKPQPSPNTPVVSGVVSYRNSTSNHNIAFNDRLGRRVVSYRNSTSNHNSGVVFISILCVVSYRNSTSNHNPQSAGEYREEVVSYRNSTSNHNVDAVSMSGVSSCILSKFYIKPQHPPFV